MVNPTAFVPAPCLPSRVRPSLPTSRCPPRRNVTATARLPASVASVEDRRTGARIFLVGCVHGSQVSADDVTKLLDQTLPDAVILELCEARLATLKASVDHGFDETVATSGSGQPKRRRTFQQISATFGGAGPAFVASALELLYKLQVLSGVKPGVEFEDAISRASKFRLVCGDAPARDTVNKLYHVFASPLQSLRESMTSIEDLLSRLVFPPHGGVNILGIFVTEPSRLRELGRLTLPALVIASALSLAGTATASALEAAPAMSVFSTGFATSALPLLVSVGQTMVVSYVIVSTLHFMKVLVADRDRILARSILDTTAQLQGSTETKSATVVAVVGLLHVNGILKYIQEQNAAHT